MICIFQFFFYLSGWSSGLRDSNITRSGKSLLKLWLKWVFFITLVELVCILSPSLTGVSGLEDLFRNYLFNVSLPGFPVIAGSVWFMPVYFLVIIVNTVILMLIQKSEKKKELQRTFMWLLLGSYVWVLYGNHLFGIPPEFLFYSFFWMLGYNQIGNCGNWKRLLAALLVCSSLFFLSSYVHQQLYFDIQGAKFPTPMLKYLFASLPVILISKTFENKICHPNRFLIHIGKNAIWYFFGQSIGSSINEYVAEAVTLDIWQLKFLITIVINLVITILIAELLACSYKAISALFAKLSRRLTSA